MSRVLFVTSEAYPLVKTGGLADVSASLPAALRALGHDVRVLLPAYPLTQAPASHHAARFSVGRYAVDLWQTTLPDTGVPLWLMACPELFDRPGNPYLDAHGVDWPDNATRFDLLCRVAARIALRQAGLDWQPELVHANDWQAGLTPVHLANQPYRPPVVFTVHNLAYQGIFDRPTFDALGLAPALWHPDRLEYYGRFSFLKAGLVYGDWLTTVSPGYAREICAPEGGMGLDGVLRARSDRLEGILNGIDTRVWSPEDDPYLPAQYSARHPGDKRRCRYDLAEALGFGHSDAPMAGFIGRLVAQKGIDWLIEALPAIIQRGVRVVVLGDSEARYTEPLRQLAAEHPRQLAVILGYHEHWAHRVTAGSDLLLMPSRYEPCGLSQLYAMRYGTVPVVHGVGGLEDTVRDPDRSDPATANGFVFTEATSAALLTTLDRALVWFQRPSDWRRLRYNGMTGDYSWTMRARAYDTVYRQALAERPRPGNTHPEAIAAGS